MTFDKNGKCLNFCGWIGWIKMEKNESFEETYKHVKLYLNRTDTGNTIALLHDMCANCERWNGIKEHDYSECKDMACFKLFLRAERDAWCASFEGDGR